jgi:ABC-type transport system involved in cytochrome c biogenesis ATPase subunit
MSRKARSHASTPKSGRKDYAPFGQLVEYEITGLFGSKNVNFTLDKEEPTLLTGANGAGKSTVLRTIDAISTTRWSELFSIPFDSIILNFESGVTLSVNRRNESFEIAITNEAPWKVSTDSIWLWADSNRRRLGNLNYGGSQLENVDVSLLYPELVQSILAGIGDTKVGAAIDKISNAPDWIESIPARFPVLFVTDQRLLIEPPRKRANSSTALPGAISTRSAAEEAASNVAKEIALAQASYARESQSLDQNFPQRAIKAINKEKKVSEQELREQLQALEERRKLLRRVALLSEDNEVEFDNLTFTAPHTRAVIDTYVQDTMKKLAVLEPLRRRLALFSDFVNQHYTPKSITFDPENGFTILSKNGPESLAPARLSSGEQQILVLAHHVLFRASPGTLVLIDEPELSLHVGWQATLVDDLSAMGRERGLAFLLATHSPSLIAGRHDLRRSLDDAE